MKCRQRCESKILFAVACTSGLKLLIFSRKLFFEKGVCDN